MNEGSSNLRPVSSTRSLEDELINNILPSYHMFQSTISKRLVPNDENFKEDPPRYELSPMNSGYVTPVASGTMSPLAIPELSEFPFPGADGDEDFTQNSAQLFEKTILANVHKLDDLLEKSNHLASQLDVKIVFTDDVCQKGVKPTIIDVANREYHQDDYLHGYVTMTNRHSEAIPFDMVYVIFEGSLVVVQSSNGLKDHDHPPTVFKFLNMPDLFASWTFANIDRLVTDEGNPHDWCVGETDPYDNTTLSIDAKRLFQPNVTYKRFFSFRVPDRLLDDTCDVHNLDAHCELIPTLGHPVSFSSPRRIQEYSEKRLKDFSFMDTFISYSVSTKIIGKASQYDYKVPKDKYVLTKEVSAPVRVVPLATPLEYPEYEDKKVNACYRAFKDTVERKLEEGLLVQLSIRSGSDASLASLTNQFSSLSPQASRGSQTGEKLRHLYNVSSTNLRKSEKQEQHVYQSLLSYRKKTLTGFSKVLGVFSLTTPKTTYTFNYIPPPAFRTPQQTFNTQLEIPLEMSYIYEHNGQLQTPPEPKNISVELILLTVRSKKHLIPIEFNHEMCFQDHLIGDMSSRKPIEDAPNFDSIVIKPFLDYFHRLVAMMKTIGFNNDAFRVETLLFKDIKSMAMLQTKYINLAVPDVEVATVTESGGGVSKSLAAIPWEESQSVANPNSKILTKNLKLRINLDTCHLKGTAAPAGKSSFDVLTLVPNFQSCLLARFYYFRIIVKHKNGLSQVVHVPMNIDAYENSK